MSAPDPLPSVLILGASGMIGRNLVEFIISRGLASSVRAVDKRLPPRAFVRCVTRGGGVRNAAALTVWAGECSLWYCSSENAARTGAAAGGPVLALCLFVLRAHGPRPPPSVPHHSRRHLEFFQSPLVDFVQADLAEDEHVANAFRRPSGTPFDFVVCCAAETGFGRDEERYVKVRWLM